MQLSADLQEKLDIYEALVRKWQPKINLISSATLPDLWNRHFKDALGLVQHIPKNASACVDLGSGGGFPGLVLAMALPEKRFFLIESDMRKCIFLETVSRETGLKNVTIVNQRIENALETIENIDVISARALASMDKLFNFIAPVFSDRPTCVALFPKGENYRAEVEAAQESFDFFVDVLPSPTSEDAAILRVTGLRPLS